MITWLNVEWEVNVLTIPVIPSDKSARVVAHSDFINGLKIDMMSMAVFLQLGIP